MSLAPSLQLPLSTSLSHWPEKDRLQCTEAHAKALEIEAQNIHHLAYIIYSPYFGDRFPRLFDSLAARISEPPESTIAAPLAHILEQVTTNLDNDIEITPDFAAKIKEAYCAVLNFHSKEAKNEISFTNFCLIMQFLNNLHFFLNFRDLENSSNEANVNQSKYEITELLDLAFSNSANESIITQLQDEIVKLIKEVNTSCLSRQIDQTSEQLLLHSSIEHVVLAVAKTFISPQYYESQCVLCGCTAKKNIALVKLQNQQLRENVLSIGNDRKAAKLVDDFFESIEKFSEESDKEKKLVLAYNIMSEPALDFHKSLLINVTCLSSNNGENSQADQEAAVLLSNAILDTLKE